jgi:hypothetical protein
VPGLAGGCVSVFLQSADDPWTFATLLGAHTQNVSFVIRYDSDQRAPWDPNSCAITSVTQGE